MAPPAITPQATPSGSSVCPGASAGSSNAQKTFLSIQQSPFDSQATSQKHVPVHEPQFPLHEGPPGVEDGFSGRGGVGGGGDSEYQEAFGAVSDTVDGAIGKGVGDAVKDGIRGG